MISKVKTTLGRKIFIFYKSVISQLISGKFPEAETRQWPFSR